MYNNIKTNCSESEKNEDLIKAFIRFQIIQEPKRISYTPTTSILQDGPQCGLVALAMLLDNPDKNVNSILTKAIELGYTNNGEIFSVDDMCELASIYTNRKLQIHCGPLNTEHIQQFLFSGGRMLVPYDSDMNHEPCLKNGHKAHWALICGALEVDDVYVLAKHGKSNHLGVWSLERLAESNRQLLEFAPHRKLSDLVYKLPEGGIAGPLGLNNRCVLIHSLATLS